MPKYHKKPSELLRINHLPQVRNLFVKTRTVHDRIVKVEGACALGKLLLRRGASAKAIQNDHFGLYDKYLADIPEHTRHDIMVWNDNQKLSFEQIADKLAERGL